jgi:hypothetical protein
MYVMVLTASPLCGRKSRSPPAPLNAMFRVGRRRVFETSLYSHAVLWVGLDWPRACAVLCHGPLPPTPPHPLPSNRLQYQILISRAEGPCRVQDATSREGGKAPHQLAGRILLSIHPFSHSLVSFSVFTAVVKKTNTNTAGTTYFESGQAPPTHTHKAPSDKPNQVSKKDPKRTC